MTTTPDEFLEHIRELIARNDSHGLTRVEVKRLCNAFLYLDNAAQEGYDCLPQEWQHNGFRVAK